MKKYKNAKKINIEDELYTEKFDTCPECSECDNKTRLKCRICEDPLCQECAIKSKYINFVCCQICAAEFFNYEVEE
jgi:hypothetical protein